MQLSGKHALGTGGFATIGRAFVSALAAAGRVTMPDLHEGKLRPDAGYLGVACGD